MGAYPKRTATPPKAYSGVPKTPGPKRVGSHPSRHVHKDQQHRSDHQRLWKRETFLKGRDENKLSRKASRSGSAKPGSSGANSRQGRRNGRLKTTAFRLPSARVNAIADGRRGPGETEANSGCV
ncbi:uncharacterized protein LOC142584898 isoform X2 [Dermacentor variabilis]|uniref:uncharacterized protein LOC142584898 isoform X2 n=1 Tax=Dermacentor variabilis TaxID=34621 RepID=UPI003F5CBCA1